jgi:excisionase family DNA binding protein
MSLPSEMSLPAERLLTEKEVSAVLNVKLSCLRRWRFENRELPFVRVGRLVRYRPADVKQFVSYNIQKLSNTKMEINDEELPAGKRYLSTCTEGAKSASQLEVRSQ